MRTYGYTETSFMVEPDGENLAILFQLPGLKITEKGDALLVETTGKGGNLAPAIRSLKAMMDKGKSRTA